MIRAVKWLAWTAAALVIVAIGSPLLMIFGGAKRVRGELVVDEDLLGPDDPGVDVDEAYS